MYFRDYRPKGFTGKGDRLLPKIIAELTEVLIEAEAFFEYSTLCLEHEKWETIACILVEFAEDMHNDIGIWKSYEKYNYEFFGIPLPLTGDAGQDKEPEKINPYRIYHLLWVLYRELNSDLMISPRHRDLWELSQTATDFLVSTFGKVPHDSGVKRFLSQTKKYGWNVKEKLLWLGRDSYLFRLCYNNYMSLHSNDDVIGVIDDFILQETTCWSGLGVIDILAGIIDISTEQKNELQSWYERHNAYFKILSSKGTLIDVMNIINNASYTVRVEKDITHYFRPGKLFHGSLIPWNNEWYWSGKQSVWDHVSEEQLDDIKKEFIKIVPKIVYRYDKELLKHAQEEVKNHYKDFVNYYGDNLKIYPDGLTMAADVQKYFRKYYESLPADVLSNHIKKYNLKNLWPTISYPPEILKSNNGIGLFFNKEEGYEIMLEFNDVLSGFKKKGVNLNEDEESSIRSFIYSKAISPKFVTKVGENFGYESIYSSFYIHDNIDDTSLVYLLRRYKSEYYRNRYPSLGFI